MTSIPDAERPHPSRALPRAAILVWLVLPAFPAYARPSETPPADSALVARALANELKAAQDTAHPMQYKLRKSSPRLTSVKQIVETRDGAVAHLLSINGNSLSPEDRQKEEARLDALLADPTRQLRRKHGQQDDTARALKVLRALPKAFLYQYAGSVVSGSETIQRYTFTPNPKFNPRDLELVVLTAMSGELAIDPARERVLRLEGHLQQDVDIGWGLLARLYKGGWILIEQGDVGGGQWRILRFQMAMNGRVFFKTRSFDTTEEQSHFQPVPVGMTYQQAIQMLRSSEGTAGARGR